MDRKYIKLGELGENGCPRSQERLFFFFKNEELKPYVYANKKNLKGKKKYIYEEREHREGC